MITDLNLSGSELLCYAIIYGFSQDEKSLFMGSLKYLMGWMNVSQPTVLTALDKLMKKGYIKKIEEIKNNVRYCYYMAFSRETIKAKGGTKEILVPTKDSLDNNIDNNNKENKKDKNKFLSKKVEEGSLFPEVTDEKEKNYLEHMHEHYPLIMKMDKPLTYDEFKTLRENFDVDLVWDKMDNLENTKNMRKKYVSAYLTLNNWCKMSFNREPKKKEDEQ